MIGFRLSVPFLRQLPIAFFAVLLFGNASAASPAKADIPEPLRPWANWVLNDTPDHDCPYFYNSDEARQCTWPSSIDLSLDRHGGSFGHRIEMFRRLWVPLPGDADHWPQEVTVDGKAVPVTPRDEMPGVLIESGMHRVAGAFHWDDLPESLQLPAHAALVSLRLDGREIDSPRLDEDGHLWLQKQSSETNGSERLDIRASRLLDDDIPFRVTTQIELMVSGKNREAVLPTVLLPGFTPLSMSSQLPARLDPDGKLRIQLRPGRWEVSVTARSMTPPASLALPAANVPLASEEIWAFRTHNDLRVVNPEGRTPVDPKQTVLPEEWKLLPAFRMRPGETLKLAESKRGDPLPPPDNLNLERTMWLDFDGGGYTIQDHIDGTLSRGWRLEMGAPATLGRASIDGEDQFITGSDKARGIEVRKGKADINADSRIDSDTRSFGATGWKQDFQQASVRLNLPPGWRLFAASGADETYGSWISQWSLLEFFIVLIAALSCGKLWGWRWGTAALATLALSYHEPDAPRWIWLAVLASAALLKMLPKDVRVRKAVRIFHGAALLMLALFLLPFAAMQIRQTLYPALEVVSYSTRAERLSAPMTAEMSSLPKPAIEELRLMRAPAFIPPPEINLPESEIKSAAEASSLKRNATASPAAPANDYRLDQVDPSAIVQTGPGLPTWTWRSCTFAWHGPVESSQQIRLWLLSPAMNALLAALRVVLLGTLFARVLDRPIPRPRLPRASMASFLFVLAFSASMIAPPDAKAGGFPDQEMLTELKTRLTKSPSCLPSCADIARMRIDVDGASLSVRLEVHADTGTAIPLPGGAHQWTAQSVSIDGKTADGMVRDSDGSIWLMLTQGVHQVVMQGRTGRSDNLQLSLPLKPHRLEAHANGWTVSGIHENGIADDNLQLMRVAKNTDGKTVIQEGAMPPFVRVERTLMLGLRWQVHTQVTRIAPADAPIFVNVPLLPGESVTSAEPHVEKGVAQVNLSPQTQTVAWDSALKEQPALTLKAAEQDNLIEVWRLNAGTQWHVDLSGIPVIHHQDDNARWLPEWRPWPGEEVALKIAKPAGVSGQTLTLDGSSLTVDPGMRTSTIHLHLDLRASRGELHAVTLPQDAVLQSVSINSQTLPIRLEGRKARLPLQPGRQQVEIDWRQPGGITTFFRVPAVDVGMTGVNASTTVRMPHDRWTTLLGGPRMGPAVLFWELAAVVALLAFGFKHIELAPLNGLQWFLLGLGLTQAPWPIAVVFVGWLFALGMRQRYGARLADAFFKGSQVLLVLWTVIALAALFATVAHGLIGSPEMRISGNHSFHSTLEWYQDRSAPLLPQPWIFSLPLLAYRLLMLLWALWLAYTLLKWLKWGWSCFMEGGYWRNAQEY